MITKLILFILYPDQMLDLEVVRLFTIWEETAVIIG